ncbi:MAG: enoyl-CoA hydratase-related protein [Paracoccaceae bacterium]
MAFDHIIVDDRDGVRTITLDRPDAMNALSEALLRELVAALEEGDRADAVRAFVVTGSDKAFAAGADVAEMADKSFQDIYSARFLAPESRRLAAVRKPVVAAVAGYALGGGCELAMMCDTVVAADTAKFGQPEVNLGIVPGMGGTQRLTRLIGRAKAMDMCLTGRMMGAEEAERAGLVSRVVPAKDLRKEATAVAHKIAEKGQLAVMAVKDCINRAEELPLAEGLRYERAIFQGLFATEDQAEGMAAFREKREPQFRDR